MTGSYLIALIGSVGMLSMVMLCGENKGGEMGICESLSLLVFLTRCGLNLANCFVFVIHAEIFPTFFLSTSYGLCNFVGRGLTLLAPIVAESPNKALPIAVVFALNFIGMIGSVLIKKK